MASVVLRKNGREPRRHVRSRRNTGGPGVGQSDTPRLLTASATSLSWAALLGHGTFDFTSSKAPRAAQLPTGEPEKCWSLRAATVVSPPPLRRPCSCSSRRDKSQTGQCCAGSAEG